MRRATRSDAPLLLELMTEFYAESGFPLDRARAAMAFSELLGDERLGQVWILEADSEPAGYFVLTFGFSMEFGGRNAFVDDLFVRRAHRGRGFGRRAIEQARATCEESGVRALHLQVDRSNPTAQALYRNAGFEGQGHDLLTLRLSEPLHETR